MNVGTSALPLNVPDARPFPARGSANRTAMPPKTRAVTGPAEVPYTEKPRAERLPAARVYGERAERKAGVRVERRHAMHLSMRTVVLFAAALGLLLFIVHSYMQLSQLNRANKEAASLLVKLKQEEKDLHKQVEVGINLEDAEAYAVGELGMVKPTSEQVIYIDLAGEDHAEILPVKGFWGSVGKLFGTMGSKVMEIID